MVNKDNNVVILEVEISMKSFLIALSSQYIETENFTKIFPTQIFSDNFIESFLKVSLS